ncbi:MAG TPA: ammonium transporter [Thermoleophilaceae bacterium]|nr:ammonium transporter [Thermoleophilaceae bacterium]
MRRLVPRALGLAAVALLALPAVAAAQGGALAETAGQLDVTWILVATVLVMFMQAGFAFLEIGFSRAKNVGAGVAKILANFSIATIAWWAIGFGIAFGGAGALLGTDGFFFGFGQQIGSTAEIENEAFGAATAGVDGAGAAFMLFQFMFCAVSLAIVWGTTLERIKFSAYVIYAVVFAAIIYPLGAHWIFGGGFLAEIGAGVQDFAGSTVVHLVGATGALAALLLLGPRRGKYDREGKPRPIPGHSMPLAGLGVLILWLGWFGFNAGSTLGTADNRFAEVALVTQLGAAGGVIVASLLIYALTKSLDVGMSGNGAIAGLVAITAPSGYVEFWAAPLIGGVGGAVVVLGILAIEKKLDDPVGALSAHGLAGVWGTLACGLFTSDRLAEYNGVGEPGLLYSGSLEQLGVQGVGVGAAFVTVFALSFATFYAIKATIGLRVDEADEEAGLDIATHGMYGYPEQFIPAPEIGAASTGPVAARPLSGSSTTATTSTGEVPA